MLSGQYCAEDVNECLMQPNACHNGGTCFNTNGGHTCVCVNGWTGNDCSENIDDCATAVCFHGATCHDRVASFFCECPVGKTGMFFLQTHSILHMRPFYPQFHHFGSELFWFLNAGLLCHLDDACVSNPCNEGAVCDTNPLNGRAICTCPAGFVGGACNQDMDECSIGTFILTPLLFNSIYFISMTNHDTFVKENDVSDTYFLNLWSYKINVMVENCRIRSENIT